MLEREQPALVVDPEIPERADPGGADNAVARDERAEPVPRAERAGGAGGAGMPGERRELAVGDDLAARHAPEGSGALTVEAVVVVELDVGEVVRPTCEEGGDA